MCIHLVINMCVLEAYSGDYLLLLSEEQDVDTPDAASDYATWQPIKWIRYPAIISEYISFFSPKPVRHVAVLNRGDTGVNLSELKLYGHSKFWAVTKIAYVNQIVKVIIRVKLSQICLP